MHHSPLPTPDTSSPGETIEYAKKKAVTEAYKNAFQSMAIILLRTGKVALHFLGIASLSLSDFVGRRHKADLVATQSVG